MAAHALTPAHAQYMIASQNKRLVDEARNSRLNPAKRGIMPESLERD